MRQTARNYSGEQKQLVRTQVVTPGKKYERVACLPGPYIRSVLLYLETGNFTKNTEVTVIECKPSVMEEIKRKFNKLPFRKVNYSLGWVEETPDYGPYDLVNLDTCSSLSRSMLNWIAQQRFLEGGEFNVWLTTFRSNQQTRDDLLESFLRTRKGVSVLSAIREYMTLDPVQMVTAAALYSALNKYNCTPMPMLKYCEHVNFMYVYRFTELTKAKSPRPSLDEVLVKTESEKLDWTGKGHSPTKLANDSLLIQCLKVLRGEAHPAYTTRQFRIEIKNGTLAGKAEKWIKAGWKSTISRMCRGDDDMKIRAHAYIDKL